MAVSENWKTKTTDVIRQSDVTMQLSRKYGQMVARVPFTNEQLLVHVANKIKQTDYAIRKNKALLGKLVNWITREDLEFVTFDGVVIRQVRELMGDPEFETVQLNGSYRVTLEQARKMYELVKEHNESTT